VIVVVLLRARQHLSRGAQTGQGADLIRIDMADSNHRRMTPPGNFNDQMRAIAVTTLISHGFDH
jgi:hypothetical protein